jgi:hypothetical protein
MGMFTKKVIYVSMFREGDMDEVVELRAWVWITIAAGFIAVSGVMLYG